jgi:hypothetical protein
VFLPKKHLKMEPILFFTNHVVGAKSIDGLVGKVLSGMFTVSTLKYNKQLTNKMTKVILQSI